jgi:hypothetical protein
MIAMEDSTELIKVTNVVGTTWTIARGQESSTATSHTNGATIRSVITKAITDTFVQLQTGTPTAQTGNVKIDNSTGHGIDVSVSSGIGVESITSSNGTGLHGKATGTSGFGVYAEASGTNSVAAYLQSGVAGRVLQVNSGNNTDTTVRISEASGQTVDLIELIDNSAVRQGGVKPGGIFDMKKALINGVTHTVDTYANRPGSPTAGDIHYATDRHLEYYWDGTRWLSTSIKEALFQFDSTQPLAQAQQDANINIPNYDTGGFYLESLWRRYFFGTGQSSTNKYTLTLFSVDTSGTVSSTGIAAPADTSTLTTANSWRPLKDTYNQAFGNTIMGMQLRHTVSNAPGTFRCIAVVSYRLVG